MLADTHTHIHAEMYTPRYSQAYDPWMYMHEDMRISAHMLIAVINYKCIHI